MKKTKLRILLQSKGMSAAELSKKIKSVNMRAVQAIAQGVRKPSVEVAQEIAKALRVKLDDIL